MRTRSFVSRHASPAISRTVLFSSFDTVSEDCLQFLTAWERRVRNLSWEARARTFSIALAHSRDTSAGLLAAKTSLHSDIHCFESGNILTKHRTAGKLATACHSFAKPLSTAWRTRPSCENCSEGTQNRSHQQSTIVPEQCI